MTLFTYENYVLELPKSLIIKRTSEEQSKRDLLHLIENTFDRKRIYANPSFYPTPILKRNNVFGPTK